MNKLTKIILLSSIAIVIGLIIGVTYKSIYNELFLSQECWAQINTKKMEFDGLIKDKFIDSNNHNTEALTVINHNRANTIHFPDPQEFELWDRTKVNDSIKKRNNSLIFYLKDSAKWDTILVKYNCK